jgi:phenylacetate-CoA ligase
VFDAALAQLSLAASLATGRRLNLRRLEQLTDAMCATVAEFGAMTGAPGGVLSGPVLADDVRRDVALRRFRSQAVRAVAGTDHYASLFSALELDPGRLTYDDVARLPTTSKTALRDAPGRFVHRDARPVTRATTTGTTGRATSVHYSDYELRVIAALTANHMVLRRLIRTGDVVALCISSRATLALGSVTSTCQRVGAVASLIGLVDPIDALAQLARGATAQSPTVLNVYASYLGALVEQGLRAGYRPRDFALDRILVGGEIVTEGLLRRARRVFGDIEFAENCAMTEIAPAGGTPCTAGHLHLEPSTGMVEVLRLDGDEPALPDEPGRLVVTPLPPYRETTLLLRYDTEDVVSALDGPLACELRHLPATSRIAGKRALALRHDDGWLFQRPVQEALEQLDVVPLPARYGYWRAGGGVAVEAYVRDDSIATRSAVRDSLLAASVPVTELSLETDPARLQRAHAVRADLREQSFIAQPTQLQAAGQA